MSLNQLQRAVITIFMIVTLTIVDFVSPAYAAPTVLSNFPVENITQQGNNILQQGNGNSVTILPSAISSPSEDPIGDALGWLASATMEAAKAVVGTAIICYTADGLATTVFPPAGALLPFCPAIGSATGTQLLPKMQPSL